MATTQTDTPQGTTASADISPMELQLAARNHGMPLEALRADLTPIGLHYLLIHYDIPFVDPAQWQLAVGGAVQRPLELSLDDLRRRPAVTLPVTLECAGNGRSLMSPRAISQPWVREAVGTAEWTGTPLAGLLEDAGLDDDAVEVVFTGLDAGVEGGAAQHYARSLTVAEAQRADVLVAYAINGVDLPPQHGFPARLLVPGWYGMASVKWLASITAVTEPFTGYQQARAYRWKLDPDDPGTPLDRIAIRSLMAPPGVAEFPTGMRYVRVGPCEVIGRAWSGAAPIARVEFSSDGGTTWADAELDAPLGPYAWRGWRYRWDVAAPGEYEVCCRATDTQGTTQPEQPVWNLGGYCGNAIHRVPVTATT
jgi:sulfane dehydrogenase subunit SoxC